MSERGHSWEGEVLADKWRLERLIGQGGMGSVYEAVHLRTAKRVAVKLLAPELRSTPAAERLSREGYLANLINDPGVVATFDDGVANDGTPFLVMELLEGESLEERALRHGGTLPLDEVVSAGHQVLGTLAKAHGAGVIHRDLKPSNLFLTHDGHIKILDFGLARSMKLPHLRITREHTAMGTLGFMPPEQIHGDWELVDGKSDIWALGATLFALLTGFCPHERGPGAQFMKRAMLEPAPPLRSIAPEVPEAIAAVIDRALARDRNARPASAGLMQAALLEAHHAATGEDVAVVSESTLRLAARRQSPAEWPADEDAPLDEPTMRVGPRAAGQPTADATVFPLQASLEPASIASVKAPARRSRVPLLLGVAGATSLLAVAAFALRPRTHADLVPAEAVHVVAAGLTIRPAPRPAASPTPRAEPPLPPPRARPREAPSEPVRPAVSAPVPVDKDRRL